LLWGLGPVACWAMPCPAPALGLCNHSLALRASLLMAMMIFVTHKSCCNSPLWHWLLTLSPLCSWGLAHHAERQCNQGQGPHTRFARQHASFCFTKFKSGSTGWSIWASKAATYKIGHSLKEQSIHVLLQCLALVEHSV